MLIVGMYPSETNILIPRGRGKVGTFNVLGEKTPHFWQQCAAIRTSWERVSREKETRPFHLSPTKAAAHKRSSHLSGLENPPFQENKLIFLVLKKRPARGL